MRRARATREGEETIRGAQMPRRASSEGRRARAPRPRMTRGVDADLEEERPPGLPLEEPLLEFLLPLLPRLPALLPLCPPPLFREALLPLSREALLSRDALLMGEVVLIVAATPPDEVVDAPPRGLLEACLLPGDVMFVAVVVFVVFVFIAVGTMRALP